MVLARSHARPLLTGPTPSTALGASNQGWCAQPDESLTYVGCTRLNIPGDPAARLLFGDDEVLGQLDGRGMEDIQRLITIAPVNVRKTLPEQPRALQTFLTPGPSRRRQQNHFFMAVMKTLQTSFRSWIVISGILSEMRTPIFAQQHVLDLLGLPAILS